MSIKKFTQNIDENGEDFTSNLLNYQDFCEKIQSELEALENSLNKDEIKAFNKQASLEAIDNYKRQIIYIKGINANADDKSWQESLAKFLLMIDEFIQKSFLDPDPICDNLRDNLAKGFTFS